jgi:para-nitrobenzyl esterase
MVSKLTRILLCSLAGLDVAGIANAKQATAVVRVDSGQLQGVVEDGVVSYKGIPFATPPVGELRWRPPQPVAPWTGVRQASEFGANCMQGRFGPPPATGASAPAPSENCLFLNVWRPESAAARARLPVMV